MSILRLSPCPRGASRLKAVGLYRDIASVHRNRRKFQSEWLGLPRISARRLNLSERFRPSFQQNRSFNGDVLVDLRRKGSTYWILRRDGTGGAYVERCSSRNGSRI